MSDFGSTKSDRALRIRRAFFDRIHRMSTPFRMVTALLVVGACALTLPSIGTAQDRGDGDVDWHAARTTPPEEWSEELKAQIIAAGLDVEEVRAVRAFTDLVPGSLLDQESGAAASLVELERAVALRPEYVPLAAQLHLLCRSA